MTTQEAADALGFKSSSTLRTAVREGRLKPAHTTPGGHYRWDLDDLRRQLARIKGLSDD